VEHSNRDSLVIIPTYNEAENIAHLISKITEATDSLDILVVDDNSPDGTGQIVKKIMRREPRLNLLSRQKKDGLAAAYCAGFKWGLERHYQSLIQMDADFSHPPADLNRHLQGLKENDVVIGCRYISGGDTSGWSLVREGVSRLGNLYAQRLLQLPYRDLTGGFNAWRRNVLEHIDLPTIRSRGYAFQVELKYRAHKANFSILEIPIHFENRTKGTSKMSGRIVWEAAFRVLQMRYAQ
jgi:dolichol-phosphate mannosyltransferase